MKFPITTAIVQFKIYVYILPQINPDTTLTFICSGNGFMPTHTTALACRINHDIAVDDYLCGDGNYF